MNAIDYLIQYSDQNKIAAQVICAHLSQILAQPQSVNILDVGCGDGGLVLDIGKFIRDEGIESSIYIVDVDEKAVLSAHDKLTEEGFRSSSVVGRFEDTHFSRMFDFILCSHVLYYIDWRQALPALFNVLNDNGVICVIMQSQTSEKYNLENDITKLFYPQANNSGSVEDFCLSLNEAGIKYGINWQEGVFNIPPLVRSSFIDSLVTYVSERFPIHDVGTMRETLQSKIPDRIRLRDGFVWLSPATELPVIAPIPQQPIAHRLAERLD